MPNKIFNNPKLAQISTKLIQGTWQLHHRQQEEPLFLESFLSFSETLSPLQQQQIRNRGAIQLQPTAPLQGKFWNHGTKMELKIRAYQEELLIVLPEQIEGTYGIKPGECTYQFHSSKTIRGGKQAFFVLPLFLSLDTMKAQPGQFSFSFSQGLHQMTFQF